MTQRIKTILVGSAVATLLGAAAVTAQTAEMGSGMTMSDLGVDTQAGENDGPPAALTVEGFDAAEVRSRIEEAGALGTDRRDALLSRLDEVGPGDDDLAPFLEEVRGALDI
ncbi:hypothetical protein [Tranquillimonas rosea]|uniref:hypothetical protein n=1 Tax=Tranquillimonas rosea TaxID=641238 RepID=UPI003BAADDF9